MSENVETSINSGVQSFADMIDDYTPQKARVVTATVLSVEPTGINVDAGGKHTGFIPLSEYSDDPTADPSKELKPGDEIKLKVIKTNDEDGIDTLSKKQYDKEKAWDEMPEGPFQVVRFSYPETVNEALDENEAPVAKEGADTSEIVKEDIKPENVYLIRKGDKNKKRKNKGNGDTGNYRVKEIKVALDKLYDGVKIGDIVFINSNGDYTKENLFDEVVEGKVVGVVKGKEDSQVKGLFVDWKSVRVFIPSSLAKERKNDVIDESVVGTVVKFKLIEINKRAKRVVGSIKAIFASEKKARLEKFWEDVEIGKTYKGTVRSLTDYGAFIDIGGVDGLVHISELSWDRIKHPSDVIKVGDAVEVYVKSLDREKNRISLGYRRPEDNPWEILKSQYPIGSVFKTNIVGLTTFGAFASVVAGIDGLIHISEISNTRIEKPSDVLKVGDEVEVKLIDVDFQKKRVSLSIKQTIDQSETSQTEDFVEEGKPIPIEEIQPVNDEE